MVIGGDNDRPELLAATCAGAQVLVHEGTCTRGVAHRSEAGYGHSYAAQVAEFAESAALPHLILTHFSPRYQLDPARAPSIHDLRAEAAALCSGDLHMAEDLARYRLDRRGNLRRQRLTGESTAAPEQR